MGKDDRQIVHLSDDDTRAAIEILAYVARPHRLLHTIKLLEQYVYKRAQLDGWNTPENMALPKPSRLEPQLQNFCADFRKGLEASRWLQRKILQGGNWKSLRNQQPFNGFAPYSLRKLASQKYPYHQNEDAIGPIISRTWSRRERVLHMALAAGNAIGRIHVERDQRGFDLNIGIYEAGSWVPEAVRAAEDWARTASILKIVEANRLYCFTR